MSGKEDMDLTHLTQLNPDASQRPIYTPAQIQAYVTRIALPNEQYSSPVFSEPALATTISHGLPLLEALLRHHVSSIPFENLELHYSVHRTISLDMQHLFDKFVVRGLTFGRGGRCMENNGFFGTVLRSLGYDVRNCAGRVSRMMSANAETRATQGMTYDPWNHMLNLVRLEQRWYVVDVGMGASGPNCVYPLQHDFVTEAIAPRRIRLQHRVIPEHAAREERDAPKLWCYDVCYSPKPDPKDDHWIPMYCFTETEFLPQDYEMMSWFTSTHPRSFFTYSILCTRMLLSDDKSQIVGDITLFNDTIRRTTAGNREVIAEVQSEAARVQALRELFGVELTDEQRHAIRENVRLE